jgi:hypothetical protein
LREKIPCANDVRGKFVQRGISMTGSAKTLALAMAAAAFAISVLPAAALVACNRAGECWHVRGNYVYRPEFGVVLHPDNWRWRAREHFRWREHDGRGYWHQGVWIAF